MFWGLIMEPQRRYSQVVKKSFHISMAALDISNADDQPAQIMCSYKGRNYLLCTLRKPDMVQCPLDLNFDEGSEISFASNGKSHVHLTGYLVDVSDEFDEEEDEGEESDVEEEEEVKVSKKKKSATTLSSPPKKKTKLENSKEDVLEEEDDEDDDDFNADDLSSGSEEVEEEEDNEDGSDDEEDSSEDEEEEEEAPKANGTAKKAQTPTKKENKNAKVNGKPVETKKKSRKLPNGVEIEDIVIGTGPKAEKGKYVSMYYEGRLAQNNKLFDSTKSGPGFKFRLGSGEVISGWDTGVIGMKLGGKRRLTCPPKAAYGIRGQPPTIPPNSTLVFDVELVKVSK